MFNLFVCESMRVLGLIVGILLFLCLLSILLKVFVVLAAIGLVVLLLLKAFFSIKNFCIRKYRKYDYL